MVREKEMVWQNEMDAAQTLVQANALVASAGAVGQLLSLTHGFFLPTLMTFQTRFPASQIRR
jgi:hypothetical protein